MIRRGEDFDAAADALLEALRVWPEHPPAIALGGGPEHDQRDGGARMTGRHLCAAACRNH